MGAGALQLRVILPVIFLQWLEQTALAIWVGESLYGYPFLLAMHAVGLALIVGLSTVTSLRLLNIVGFASVESLASIIQIAWLGLAVNALSGLALFSSQATYFITSTPFLSKITLIACGVVSTAVIQNRIRSGREVARLLALSSLLFWFAAIVAGRLIAYL